MEAILLPYKCFGDYQGTFGSDPPPAQVVRRIPGSPGSDPPPTPLCRRLSGLPGNDPPPAGISVTPPAQVAATVKASPEAICTEQRLRRLPRLLSRLPPEACLLLPTLCAAFDLRSAGINLSPHTSCYPLCCRKLCAFPRKHPHTPREHRESKETNKNTEKNTGKHQ